MELAQEEFITVDTEFMREKTYYPQLCLIQAAGKHSAAIIDPLAPGINLDAFYKVLANPAVLKVFHACRQDMEIFYHAMGTLPTPVFDSQIAAMVCGYGESASYETLVGKILGIAIDKSSRFTDWSHRPLTDKQLAYALDDVLHLRGIYSALASRLLETGRKDWIKEEMEPVSHPETYENNPDEAWKKLRLRNASPRYLAYVQAAGRWRELTARDRNVPRSRIMKDETLAEVAQAKPENFAALQKIRGFHPTMSATHYDPLFHTLQQVQSLPTSAYPQLPPRPSFLPGNEALVDLLRLLLKACAGENQVVPRLIADKDELELLANGKRNHIKALHGWRHAIFGEKALRLLEGKIALKADGNSGIAFIEA